MRNLSGNDFAWLVVGVPAVLGWLAVLLCWLLSPRLGLDLSPVVWGVVAIVGWYGLLATLASGWLGVIVLAGLLP